MTTEQAIAYAQHKALGKISPEEDILLKEWIENASRREYLQFSDACILFMEQLESTASEHHPAATAAIHHLDGYMRKAGQPVYRRLLPSPAGWWAAALLMIVLSGAAWLLLHRPAPQQPIATESRRTYEKPSLTIGEGTVITLDSPLISVPLPIDYTEQILLEEKNRAHPYVKIHAGPEGTTGLSYHTIEAPPLRQYKITFPDGSLVWLNTGSRIEYRTPFGSRDRRISLTGEAYFEVAPDAGHPFIVTAGQAEIQALGTRFNVHAYGDEPNSSVTLLSGAVNVTEGNTTRLLSPGEQALLPAGDIGLLHPDTTHIVNWKEGYFDFQRSSLQTMMREIARWYGVKVVYAPGIDPGVYTGTLSRNITLRDMITLLRASGIGLRLEGDTLLVESVLNFSSK